MGSLLQGSQALQLTSRAIHGQESFRRVRARGSRRALRLLWEDLNWWLMKDLCWANHSELKRAHPELCSHCWKSTKIVLDSEFGTNSISSAFGSLCLWLPSALGAMNLEPVVYAG